MAPTEPLSVVLQAQEWNVVMSALHEAPMPYRLTGAIIDKLTMQFKARSAMPGNGRDRPADAQENLPRRPRLATDDYGPLTPDRSA